MLSAPARRLTSAAVAAAALAAGAAAATSAAPTTAEKPKLRVQACVFAASKKVPYFATGLKAGRRFSVTLRGRRIAAGRVRGDGTVAGSLRAPGIGRRPRELVSTLQVRTATERLSRRFTTTSFSAAITPAVKGHSPRERFRFRLLGFLRGGVIYVHYVRPNGRARASYRLGTPQGQCGHLLSAERVLFPFGKIDKGTWHLQFDKRRRYSRRAPAPRARIRISIL